jgi:glycosyltransferase involved in cell wall biosynthesis
MLTQVYPKDPAAVGQYFEDAAIRLAEMGHRVTVYTADRDYDNPSIRYDDASRHANVRVVRLPFTSFGKKTILHRLASQASYLGQCFLRLLFARKVGAVVFTTIPATTGVMYLCLSWFRRFHTFYWVMDINPDQAVALGAVRAGSLSEKLLGMANRKLIEKADSVVVLDNYMADRLLKKFPQGHLRQQVSNRLSVIPPWPLREHTSSEQVTDLTEVRKQLGITNQLVFLYSGNHSMVHPLDGLLAGINAREDWDNALFLFVGGGRGKRAVMEMIERRKGRNMRSLPYQPLEDLAGILAAADIHIVAMGAKMVGIVHPCKIYGAMAAGRPILLYGPKASPLSAIVSQHQLGWIIEPDTEPDTIRQQLEAILATPQAELDAMGQRSRQVIEEHFDADKVAERLCRLIADEK